MAKKKLNETPDDSLKVLSPEEIKEAEKTLKPAGELVPIGNEWGTALGIDQSKVNGYLLAFTPHISKIVELEDKFNKINFEEPTDADVELAKELLPLYRENRKSSDATHKSEKDSFVKEGRLLDKLKNAVLAGTSIKEDKLKEVVDFAEKKENERISALVNERRELLEAQDYDASFLTDLGIMEANRFNKLLSKATETKTALDKAVKYDEQEEQKKQELEARKKLRIDLITSVGCEWNEEKAHYSNVDDFEINLKAVNEATEEQFKEWYDAAKVKFDTRKLEEANALQAEKEKAEKITNRINAITAQGLIFDEVTGLYTGYGQTISLVQVKTLGAQGFTDWFNGAKAAVKTAKDKAAAEALELKNKQSAEKAEADRLKKAEADRVAEEKRKKDAAEALKRAPDKEKFRDFYLKLKALIIEFPIMESEAGKDAGRAFQIASHKCLDTARIEAQKLV